MSRLVTLVFKVTGVQCAKRTTSLAEYYYKSARCVLSALTDCFPTPINTKVTRQIALFRPRSCLARHLTELLQPTTCPADLGLSLPKGSSHNSRLAFLHQRLEGWRESGPLRKALINFAIHQRSGHTPSLIPGMPGMPGLAQASKIAAIEQTSDR